MRLKARYFYLLRTNETGINMKNAIPSRDISGSKAFSEYTKMNPKSLAHGQKSAEFIPSGLSRGLLRHAPFPFYIVVGGGASTTDLDGNVRLDFHGNYTAQIHGHGHPEITSAVTDQLKQGTSYPAPPTYESSLAEHLCRRIPSVQKVVFNCSGSEAVMVAIRVARAHTGRNRIALFEGCYHGSTDGVLVEHENFSATAPATLVSDPQPAMAGLPDSVTKEAILIRYNDPQAVVDAVDKYGDELAAILVEPIQGGAGMIPAGPEFIKTIREITENRGIVMICDEVISLRQAVGGAQSFMGVTPDITTMAKIIGGGFPIGAVGGKNEFMRLLNAPEEGGIVANLGTYSANPVSMRAGLVGMQLLDEAAISKLNYQGQMVREGIATTIAKHGAPAQVTGTGSLFMIHWTTSPIKDIRTAERANPELGMLTFIGLANRGVQLSMRGLACLSTPMADSDINTLISAFDDTLMELKKESWF